VTFAAWGFLALVGAIFMFVCLTVVIVMPLWDIGPLG
jgi:hypothetical protein